MLPPNPGPAFVPAGGSNVPGKPHPQPCLLRAAEGFREPDRVSGLMPDSRDVGTFAPAFVPSNRKMTRQFAKAVTDRKSFPLALERAQATPGNIRVSTFVISDGRGWHCGNRPSRSTMLDDAFTRRLVVI